MFEMSFALKQNSRL